MKLTTLIMLIALLQVSAGTLAQKVTLSATNAPISTIFNQIEKQTGYDFAFTGKILDKAKPVTINVKNKDLADVLKQIFDGQPLDYKIEDKSVTVSVKQPGILDKIKSALNLDKIDVHGRVIDETGQPLAGATIQIKGGSNSTITAADGTFTLKQVDPRSLVVVSFLGYDKQELPATPNMGNIRLVVTLNKLDAVQVIAYGETSQRLSVGNISSVSAKEIAEQPVGNPLLALEGKVPGLFIAQQSGMANSAVKVQIQGQNSIANGNDPFYVIDGVPYNSQMFQSNQNSGSNPLSYINPADIESISVLKDADATSIYGSRAANGAILITTKKGKAGQTQVGLNVRTGYSQDARRLDLLNTQQYLAMRNEAFKNDGLTPSANPGNAGYAPDLTIWNTGRYTDWQKVLVGKNAHYIDGSGTISGGNENTQFSLSGGYHKEGSVFPGDFSDQKASVHVNLNNTSSNKKFNVQFTTSYVYDNNQLPRTDLTYLSVSTPPDAPPLYNPDGTLNWAPNSAGTNTWANSVQPLQYTLQKYSAKTNNLIANSVLRYELFRGFEMLVNLGYTDQRNDEILTTPLSSLPPERRLTSQNSAIFTNSDLNSWNIEPQVRYKKTLGRGLLNIIAGETFYQQNGSSTLVQGSGYNSELNIQNIGSAATFSGSSSSALYKYNAFFGRSNFNWEDKYIVDISARRDGSSRFGSANKFHNFASAGIGWIFTNEQFLKSMPLLSFGKLKASYGTTGNDQIKNYQYLSLYNSVSPYDYEGTKGLFPSNLPNPFLQWELTKKINLGMDLGFLKDRILLSLDYFQNRSSNQLLSYFLPTTTGFNGITENFPATVQNTGFELMLTTENIKTTDFNWTTSVNITMPHNKLIAFPNLANSSYSSSYIIGQPLSFVKVFHYLGVDPTTGKYIFEDKNGNPTSNPNGNLDRNTIISTLPKFYGGINNSVSYKGLRLDVFLSFVKQVGLNTYFGEVPGFSLNQPVATIDHWKQPGDNAPYQKVSSGFSLVSQWQNAALNSDAAYSDASYIRLKNLSLSWQLPKNWFHQINLKDCRVFVQGQNLFTITSYKGLDPEIPNYFLNAKLPPLRTLTLGLNVTL